MTNANDRWHSNVTIIIVLDWTKLHFDLDLSWQHFLHCRELIFEPYYFEIYLLFYLKVYNSKRWKCLIENVKIFLAKLIFFIKNELSKEKCPFSSSIFAIYFVSFSIFYPSLKRKRSNRKLSNVTRFLTRSWSTFDLRFEKIRAKHFRFPFSFARSSITNHFSEILFRVIDRTRAANYNCSERGGGRERALSTQAIVAWIFESIPEADVTRHVILRRPRFNAMNAFPFPVSASRLSGIPSWNAYYVARYARVVLENGITGWINSLVEKNLLRERFSRSGHKDWFLIGINILSVERVIGRIGIF